LKRGELDLHDHIDGDIHTLILAGELDLATAAALATAVEHLCADGASRIVLDLRRLTFIDSTGLRTILHGLALCELHGRELSLIGGSQSTQRLFEITGLAAKLPFIDPESFESV